MDIRTSQDLATSFPSYDRETLQCGIAHMSVGGFHRAHMAEYMDRYLAEHPGENWMIHGIGNLDSDLTLVNAMNAQSNLYTLVEKSGEVDTCKVIGSIKEFTHAPTDPSKVINILASNNIKIISLTITEKGYCYDSSHNLDPTHPMIAADLQNDGAPVSAIGFVFEAAKRRMEQGGQPFTLLSCDNLPGNGDVARKIFTQFADLKDPAVANWIRENVTFPNSMVDRITPAPNKATVDLVASQFGIEDECSVASESFQQWVIEDNFANGRPDFGSVGAQFVPNVEPYEKMKVRALNGSHSALSYVSYLMGYREVDVAMADPLIRDFVLGYMKGEVAPTLDNVPGIDVDDYFQTLIKRFSNPAISDQVQRLAMDGSTKIPNAIVPVIESNLQASGSTEYAAFAIAAWKKYLVGIDLDGNEIEIIDPMADRFTSTIQNDGQGARSFLGIEEVFGDKISQDEGFVNQVEKATKAIDSLGIKEALSQLVNPLSRGNETAAPFNVERRFEPEQ